MGCSPLFATGCVSDSDDAEDTQEAASENDSGATFEPDGTNPDAAIGATHTSSSSPDAATSATEPEAEPTDPASTATDTVDAGNPTETVSDSQDAGNAETAESSDDADAGADAMGDVCWLEYLGDWVRCEGSGSPNLLERPGASSDECAAECLADPECTAVTDYSWFGTEGFGCGLHLGTCEEAAYNPGYAYDGAFEYRKVCGSKIPDGALVHLPTERGVRVTPESECAFKSIDFACENAEAVDAGAITGATLAECFEQCDEREDCSAVAYYLPTTFDEPIDPVCSLHLSTCDAATEASDTVRYQKKYCGSGSDAGN